VISPTTPLDLLVPDDLSERDQWVVWRREASNGRETKVPYSAAGHRARSTNPQDWTSFQKAIDSLAPTPSALFRARLCLLRR